MAQALGRVVDSAALDACSHPRGKHVIEVPAAWLGGEILVAFPVRIICARCDGGGCDGCHRRGGHRIEGDADARSVRVSLPHSMEGTVVLRLVRPFGNEATMTQLHLETRIGLSASAGVELHAMPAPPQEAIAASDRSYALKGLRNVAWAIALIAALGIVTLLATMR